MADAILERRVCQAGDLIFRKGDRGEAAYLVQRGSVEIVVIGESEEKILGTVGEGGIFGEMALIDDEPRMATARAAETAVVVTITRRMFEERLTKADPFIPPVAADLRRYHPEDERFIRGCQKRRSSVAIASASSTGGGTRSRCYVIGREFGETG